MSDLKKINTFATHYNPVNTCFIITASYTIEFINECQDSLRIQSGG